MAHNRIIREPEGKVPPESLSRLEERYRNELMAEEERLELRDRINRLRRRKAETPAETVDVQHSGLERMGR